MAKRAAVSLFLFLAFLSLSECAATQSRHKRDFEGKMIDDIIAMLGPTEEVDVILLVDRSRGIEIDTFYLRELRLLERIVRQYLTVSEAYGRIAGITFATDTETAFDSISRVGEFNKAHLFSGNEPHWDKMIFYHDDARFAETNVRIGMEAADFIFQEGRQRRGDDVRQVLLISTDGDYLNFGDTINARQTLMDSGVVIFSIGVGEWFRSNQGNVDVLASQTNYNANYSVWKRMTEDNDHLSNYDKTMSIDSDLALLEEMPTNDGFCGGECGDNSICHADAYLGVETCLCARGYYLRDDPDTTGPPSCQQCRIHSYKAIVGNFACTSCPNPMYTNSTGNTDYSACQCPIDVINNNLAAIECIDQCENRCSVNEVCVYTGTTTWDCECAPGWLDVTPDSDDTRDCQLSTNDCIGDGGVSVCQNNGLCIDMENSYQCVCKDGFMGRNCELMDDPCRFHVCVNEGTCTASSSNVFVCDCPYPWGGKWCTAEMATVEPVEPVEPTTSITAASSSSSSSSSSSTTPAIPKPTSEKATVDDGNNTTMYIIIAAAGGGLLLLILFIILVACLCLGLCCCRRRDDEPNKEVEANGGASDGSRLYQKNRNAKTFSNRFSDFWRKKTLTPGSFSAEGVKGLPSVPPRRRPDLLGHVDEDGFTTMQSDHEMEYAVFDNQTVQELGGMEGWQRYVTDISSTGLVERASIVKVEGKKRALSSAWQWDDREIDKLLIVMENSDYNVPALVQNNEFHIHSNDGTVASGKTIGSSIEPRVICVGRTGEFLIIGIADGSKDSGQCLKEVQWITDHIKTEGY